MEKMRLERDRHTSSMAPQRLYAMGFLKENAVGTRKTCRRRQAVSLEKEYVTVVYTKADLILPLLPTP